MGPAFRGLWRNQVLARGQLGRQQGMRSPPPRHLGPPDPEDVELDAVTGGLANAWLDWIADYFYLVKMEAHPTVIEC